MDGLREEIPAAVPQLVRVEALDDKGLAPAEAFFFLQVENVCNVTENYRCDPDELLSSYYEELPIYIEMLLVLEEGFADSYQAKY